MIPPVPSLKPQTTGDKQWVLSATDRVKYNQMFSQADTNKDGLVSGIEIKDILLASALPQPMLAHIWGLCDKNNSGLLNADQFAFAMHLISTVKSGKELPTVRSTTSVSCHFKVEKIRNQRAFVV